MAFEAFVIGICGGSGSGKTVLADSIARALLPRVSRTISQDCYYRPLTGPDALRPVDYNFDSPDALEWKLFAFHLGQLRQGLTVEIPDYCFVTHSRVGCRQVEPAQILILDGTLILARSEIADQLDLAVYVDVDDDIRVLRRLVRDLQERGRSVDSVVKQYLRSVRPMHLNFVAPSKNRADLVLTDGPVEKWTRQVLDLIDSRLARP